jgi:hypothetical protein
MRVKIPSIDCSILSGDEDLKRFFCECVFNAVDDMLRRIAT